MTARRALSVVLLLAVAVAIALSRLGGGSSVPVSNDPAPTVKPPEYGYIVPAPPFHGRPGHVASGTRA